MQRHSIVLSIQHHTHRYRLLSRSRSDDTTLEVLAPLVVVAAFVPLVRHFALKRSSATSIYPAEFVFGGALDRRLGVRSFYSEQASERALAVRYPSTSSTRSDIERS